MKIRHRLIRWLASGDVIILNAEFTSWKSLRSKEAGDFLIENSNFYGNNMLEIGLTIEKTKTQAADFKDVLIEKFTYCGLMLR